MHARSGGGGRSATVSGRAAAGALAPPHEWRVVDVTDAAAVEDACAGMDAIINCTVVRPDPIAAWRVNLLGVQAVMRAAVAHGIKRVVHTGPYQVAQPGPAGYAWDDFVAADASPRPGTHLYIHTKYLGQELCRVYAEWYGLKCPRYSSAISSIPASQSPIASIP